jgi:hypothetical protein
MGGWMSKMHTHGLLKCVLGVERIQWFKKVGNGLKKQL